MDELIAQVTQRTGLSPEQATQAAHAVLDFLKGRLPAPIASHLDQFITSGPQAGAAGGSGLGGLAKGLGGILGG
jgi:hypothetical protein